MGGGNVWGIARGMLMGKLSVEKMSGGNVRGVTVRGMFKGMSNGNIQGGDFRPHAGLQVYMYSSYDL